MLPSLLEWLKRVFGSFGQIHWTVHLIYAQTSYEGIKCIKAKEEYLRSYCLLYILWLTHSELKVGFGILWLYTNSLMKQSFTIEDHCSFSLLVKIIKKWSFEAWSLNHSVIDFFNPLLRPPAWQAQDQIDPFQNDLRIALQNFVF